MIYIHSNIILNKYIYLKIMHTKAHVLKFSYTLTLNALCLESYLIENKTI